MIFIYNCHEIAISQDLSAVINGLAVIYLSILELEDKKTLPNLLLYK